MRSRLILCLLVALLVGTVLPASAQQTSIMLDNLPDCGFTGFGGLDDVRIGAVVLDFNTGRGCTENLDTIFNAASVPKIFVAGLYYDWLLNGYVGANTELPFLESYWMGGRNDCLGREEIGGFYTNEELVEMMINCSDNAATWMIMDSLGWGAVSAYVSGLGIPDIGTVIPYSEVDRLKLELIDERWGAVPRGVASRYYRASITSGLSQWFDEIPPRSREALITANQRYYDEYSYNTITPRALAQYFMMLREDMLNDGENALMASRLFNVMLYTQRQFSVQALPGNILIGGKNGYDRGLLAEANVLFNDIEQKVPSGLVLLFSQVEQLTPQNAEFPNSGDDRLSAMFARLSPRISEILYPDAISEGVVGSSSLSTVTIQSTSNLFQCWLPYAQADFDTARIPALETCYNSYAPRTQFTTDESIGLGIVLDDLNNADTRMVFIFTAPDGRKFSYQTDRRFVSAAGVYWFHPIDMAGTWSIDVYINLRHVYQTRISAA